VQKAKPENGSNIWRIVGGSWAIVAFPDLCSVILFFVSTYLVRINKVADKSKKSSLEDAENFPSTLGRSLLHKAIFFLTSEMYTRWNGSATCQLADDVYSPEALSVSVVRKLNAVYSAC
jgi:hypothetical protein